MLCFCVYKIYHPIIHVIIIAFVKSTRNAPTSETIIHALAEKPYLSERDCMLASPLAVAPMAKPMPPTASITES